ncbi:MAG: DUF5110 domain-containing protein [Bacteroidales bacterium]|nr:DUF5110 domain-containing protein [Bacteroidales bacterium]
MNTFLKTVSAILLTLATLPTYSKQKDNIAYQDRQVRLTVITDGVIRLEWEPEGRFTDSPSLVASERDYPEADYKTRKKDGKIYISTARMTLAYEMNSGQFTEKNLTITSTDGMFTWKPGMKQKENLKGTFRTLDGLDGQIQVQTLVTDMKQGETRHFEDGILAKDGWTLIDESENYLFDDSKWSWVKERENKNCQDWYFMAYGHDYKAALKDFTVIAGKMPLPPRFTFGYWWSRYWAYSDKELRDLIDKFRTYDIPLDVLVIDMDWHYTDEGRGGWTGWTWNRNIFPDHRQFLSHLKDQGLKVTLNLHPADGFYAYEECYPALAKGMGMDPAEKKHIEWTNSDKTFMSNMFRHVMHPMQKEGIDFWWLDWQQHVFDKKMTRLNNTWWINYCYFSDMEQNGEKRPLLYHRWGGLGNHRYQIGFSGDATISWKSLDFQPYFTSTASNVLYGYWSHDIGGHLDIGIGIEPEMYTRWLQFGAYSPVMRTHSTKSGRLNKEPWVFPEEYADIIRNTIKSRYEMVPYIYTMARKGWEEGISLCRPLYYEWPESNEAYDFRNEYMFGDDMLIAPVTKPGENGFTSMEVWLPEGEWYEIHSGTMLEGGRIHTRRFAMDEYGVYMRSGAVQPHYRRDIKNLDSNDEDIIVTVYPGKEGSFDMYEDAGNSKDYADNYATTHLCSSRNGREQTVVIGAREGSYDGMPLERRFKVRIIASAAPSKVTVNGEECGFEYLGEDFAFVIEVPQTDCRVEKTICITYPEEDNMIIDGTIGYSRRVARTLDALKYRTGIDPRDELARMGVVNEAAMYRPEEAKRLAEEFMKNYRNLPEVLMNHYGFYHGDNFNWFLTHCGWEGKF